MNRIPKIIHYCWFGKGEIPEALEECMKSWKVLKQAGYEIIRWDESNCSFDENDFVKKCYAEKKWGYIGDYYRAKALYEIGVVYLDTDVIVKKTFDALLDREAFIGFSCDCALCTAVVGAQKGSSYIKGILQMYDTGKFYTETSYKDGKTEVEYCDGKWAPSNEYWTWYTICTHSNFVLNNKSQNLENVSVYPKHYFELGSLIAPYYCRHTNYNSWREQNKSKNFLKRIKRFAEKNTICWIIIRTLVNKKGEKYTSFYKYRKNK